MNRQFDDPHEVFTWYCIYRGKKLDVQKIAEELGFGSERHMLSSLRQDGFPVCEACGAYAKNDRCYRHRRGQTGAAGGDKNLPPARNAGELFRCTVEKLARGVLGLEHHEEIYGAGRFEQADVYPLPGGVPIHKSVMTEQDWRALCEKHGQDPAQDSFTIDASKARLPAGVDDRPRETALIAAYLLLDGPEEEPIENKVEALLDALHPEPEKADRQKLLRGNPNNPENHPGEAEKLRRAARRFARLLRGAKTGGAPAEGMPPDDQKIVWYMQEEERAGKPFKAVKKELTEMGHHGDKIDFLKNQRLNPPK